MEGPGSATIKKCSPSQVPEEGRRETSQKQKPQNYMSTIAEKLALSSPTEVVDPLQYTTNN